ncbi:MAG: MFS transporter [Candidatus Wildermuthbacteria bacterium]|nr:MFS transporter [Candidatus Wildermuthbacteria bacterium]
MQELIRSRLSYIYLAVFINALAFSLVFPLLPQYAKHFQLSDVSLGLLASSFAIAQLFLSPFWGTLSDRFGRKPIIAIGLLGMSASFFVFAAAASPILLFVSRFFQGVFSSAVLPSARAYVADSTTEENRVRAMGYVGACLATGFIFGPVLGGYLAAYSLPLPFLAAGVIALLNFLLVIGFLAESVQEKIERKISFKLIFAPIQRIWKGVLGPLAPLFILALLWSFAMSNNQVAVPVLSIEKLHLNAERIGLMFTVIGSVSAFTQFFLLNRMTKLFGKHATAIGGLFVMALAFTIMPFVPSAPLLYAAAAVAGLGSATTHPVISALLSEETKEHQGITMGTATSFESLGRLLGPLLGGSLLAFGLFTPFLVSGVIITVAVFCILVFTNFLKRGHTA